jgi:hypothetical protein
MLVIDTDGNVSGHIAFLKAKNVDTIGRYYSSDAGKRLTKTEAQKVCAAGLKLFTVFEDHHGDPRLDGDAGTSDAQIALQQAQAVGQPAGSAIYFALEHLPGGYKQQHVPGITFNKSGPSSDRPTRSASTATASYSTRCWESD